MQQVDVPGSTAPVILVVDDDPSVREALGGLFESVGLRAELFDSVDGLLEADTQPGPSCLVLDVRLSKTNGLDAYAQLRARGFRTPVIYITGHGDIPMSVRAMKSGAVDFLSKPVRDQDLLDAVNTALDRDANRRSRDSARDELVRMFDRLTPREHEILEHVVAGRLNKQIAGDLGLSEITVKVHRGNLMRKMKARSVAELVRAAQELRLLLADAPDQGHIPS